eukprot:TRINITY_DN5146_c0_g1_i3.p1 TRINITY_DN5146_c0_g1~~TRINITY_DN5146_c0_g1_i3.p1  ORF type:complete len:180 (-),score=17.16 TRINITY_DN5146_c0_g1_i3:286-825(-)
MSCPTSTASNVSAITCALSILELSQRELGAESDTLLVSVCVQLGIVTQLARFHQSGCVQKGYTISEGWTIYFCFNKGNAYPTSIYQLENPQGGNTQKRSVLLFPISPLQYPNAKALSPLPQLSPQYYEKKHQHRTRKSAIHLRDNSDDPKFLSKTRSDETITIFGQKLKVDERTLVYGV